MPEATIKSGFAASSLGGMSACVASGKCRAEEAAGVPKFPEPIELCCAASG